MVKILSYTVRNWSFSFMNLNVIYMLRRKSLVSTDTVCNDFVRQA